MPDDLRPQFPIVRELVTMMGMPIRELEGYEADDVIGSLAKEATRAGVDTMMVSGDLDGLQLVDDHVRLLTTRMGVATTVIYDEAKVDGAVRAAARPDARLQGAERRHVGQHPRRAGGRGEDRHRPAPAVRLARRDLQPAWTR